jgi:hypothetical protein
VKGFDIVAFNLNEGAEVGFDGLFVVFELVFNTPNVVGDPVEYVCGMSARVPIMTPVFHKFYYFLVLHVHTNKYTVL